MRFTRLAGIVAAGLFQEIPLIGSILQSILAERDQAAFQRRLLDILQQLADSQRAAAAVETAHPTLVRALLEAEAEAGRNLEQRATPQRRFLYLAGGRYASAVRTYSIATEYSFLWRKFHDTKKRTIARVDQVKAGDIVALGYRANGSFRLLLPLVVRPDGPNTIAIDPQQFPERDYSPFAFADDRLIHILQEEGYGPDPVFKRQVGLSVRPLYAEVSSDTAVTALQGSFTSPPGQNAIWPYDSPHLSPAVQAWIASL